ncbi:DUF4189 domain-containing protein [Rhizobium sp. CNPSo 4039]|uniref:DUF4189 domain-containing protein n=1 Tax=Rhizobium sp. CNPSo 4039 TaxID=3021409 RepID=UPI003305D1D1
MIRSLSAASVLVVAGFLFSSSDARAQCAAGIPGAGNPGCIPPSARNSPYNPPGGYPLPNGPDDAVPPEWHDSWGAVAMDEATGSAGESRNQLSKAAATDMAMRQCRIGGPHCKVIIAYYNQCVAIAQVQGRTGFFIAASRAYQSDADQYVMSECSSHGACEVVYRACSDAIRMQ